MYNDEAANLNLNYESSYNALVNSMTNRERNRWARAGYPGRADKDAHMVAVFCRRKLLTKHTVFNACNRRR